MAFKMKGSPIKLGNIQGTANHTSALKKTYTEAYSAMEDVEGGKKKDQWGRIYANQGEFEVEAQKWWEGEEGQKKAKSEEKFKHKIIEEEGGEEEEENNNNINENNNNNNNNKGVVIKKNNKKDTYGTRTEAQQNLDVRMAKRKRKQTRKKAKKEYGKGSEEYKTAKRSGRLEHLEAKGEDFRDDRGLFAGLKRIINRGKVKRLKAKIARKGNTNSDTGTEV